MYYSKFIRYDVSSFYPNPNRSQNRTNRSMQDDVVDKLVLITLSRMNDDFDVLCTKQR